MTAKTKKIIQRKENSEDIPHKRVENIMQNMLLPRRVVLQIAEEVGKAVSHRLSVRRKTKKQPVKKAEGAVFLDTSAIIDTRVFNLAKMGVFYGNFIVLEGVLRELKNIADSKDDVKKERGRTAMHHLDEFKKQKGVNLIVLQEEKEGLPVDDAIIFHAKKYKGRIITCDFNLAKKAKISSVVAIDLYEMANVLKTTALPGEEFWVKIVQAGKGIGQGVGYLPDGTMLVIENGRESIGKTVNVVVSRIIQTDAGKILFAKIKE